MAVTVDARVPSFDLARAGAGLGGTVNAVARAQGTLAAISGTLTARGDRLRVGELLLPLVELNASADGTQAVVSLDARSATRRPVEAPSAKSNAKSKPAATPEPMAATGRLSLAARIPLADATRPLEATLRASGFSFAWGGARAASTRRRRDDGGAGLRASAIVDGELSLTGTRARPIVRGRVAGHDIGLAIAALGRPLSNGRFRVDVSESALVLSELSIESGAEGRVTGKGRAALDGMSPTRVEASVEAERFPIIQGGIAAEVNARIAIRGTRNAEGLTGTITVEDGSARLPKLAVAKKLQSTGALDDVVFVDADGKRRKAKATDGARSRTSLVARIPGPFRVRAPELNTDLQGTIELNSDDDGNLVVGG